MGAKPPGRLPSKNPGGTKVRDGWVWAGNHPGTSVRTVKLSHGDSKLPQLIVPAGYSAHQGSAGARLRQLTHAEQMDCIKISSAHRGWASSGGVCSDAQGRCGIVGLRFPGACRPRPAACLHFRVGLGGPSTGPGDWFTASPTGTASRSAST
jgi:hypothetical protein